MEGIERIKRHILADADAAVEKIRQEATSHAEKTLDESKEESRRILKDAEKSASRDAAMLIRRGESLADSEKRKRDLAAKQAIADAVIDRAVAVLKGESQSKRAARYASWVRALGVQEGVVTLSESEQDLKEPLLAALGGTGFVFSEKGGGFSGGIIVQRGRVSDNLTYDLVIRDNRPELARLVFDSLENFSEDLEHA